MFGIKAFSIHPDLANSMLQVESGCFCIVLLYLILTGWKNQIVCLVSVRNRSSLFWLSLILTVVLTSVFLSQWGEMNALLSLEFGVGIVLSLLHPGYAISFFLANQILRPWNFFEG